MKPGNLLFKVLNPAVCNRKIRCSVLLRRFLAEIFLPSLL